MSRDIQLITKGVGVSCSSVYVFEVLVLLFRVECQPMDFGPCLYPIGVGVR